MLESLNNHKVLLASVPIIAYFLFIIYSFVRHFPTGFANLFLSLFGIPATIIGQVVLYFILKLAGEKSFIPVIVLTLVAGFSIITTIQKMIFFKKIKVITNKPSAPTTKAKLS